MVRILVSYSVRYRVYGQVLAFALREFRPSARVETVDIEALAGAIDRFDPHLVVSERPNFADPGGRAAWYELAPEPSDPSEICLDGEREASENPGLGELLAAVDETGRLLRAGRRPRGC